MLEIREPINQTQPGETLSWWKVWISALTRPSVATFERILRDPEASAMRGVLWVYVTYVISLFITRVFTLRGNLNAVFWFSLSFLLITPILALLWLPFFALDAGATQLVATRIFHGTGTYAELLYATAAYLAPITLIHTVISIFPHGIYIEYILYAYEIVLGVMAVKAVNRIGWVGAIISYMILLGPLLDIFLQKVMDL